MIGDWDSGKRVVGAAFLWVRAARGRFLPTCTGLSKRPTTGRTHMQAGDNKEVESLGVAVYDAGP
jgi:hypothetical protein